MLEDLFAKGQDLVSLIMSNLWWILLVGLVIVCVGEILVEGLEEFIGWAEDHVIAVLGTILTVIVGSICYIQFGHVWSLVAMAAIVILAIIAFVVTCGDLMLDVGYRSRRLSKSEETMDDEDEEYSDDEEFGDDEESESKKSVKNPVAKKGGIKMDDIAGLEEAKEAIRMRVILPVQHPEVYAKYNKKVGGGILLYGLPGTGKTMFAQAVANELDAAFYEVKCSDIVSKWYGESEQRIKKLTHPQRKTLVEKINGDMPIPAGNDDHAGNGKSSHHKFLNFKRSREIGPRMSEKHIYGYGHGKQHQRHRTDNQSNSINDRHNRFKQF